MGGKKHTKEDQGRFEDVATIRKVEFQCTEIKEKGIPDKGGNTVCA